jgi:hypothetical protein
MEAGHFIDTDGRKRHELHELSRRFRRLGTIVHICEIRVSINADAGSSHLSWCKFVKFVSAIAVNS